MNIVLQSALGSILRFGLAILAGYLVKAKIWSDSEAESYVAAAVVGLLALGWSLWEKYKSRIKFLAALSATPGTTENEVIANIKSGEATPTITTPPNTAPGVPKLPLLFLMVAIGMGLSGCIGPRLETGGPYAASPTQAAMPELFVMDSSFDLAYSALDTAFNYEKKNRAILWAVSTEIKHSMDKLRIEAQRVVLDYSLARTAYLAVPNPDNLDGLSIALSKLQSLNAAAIAVIAPKGTP